MGQPQKEKKTIMHGRQALNIIYCPYLVEANQRGRNTMDTHYFSKLCIEMRDEI